MSGFGSFKSSFSKFVDDTKSEIKGKKGDKKDEKLVSNPPPPPRPSQQPVNLNKSNDQSSQQQQYQQPQYQQQQQQYQPQYQQQYQQQSQYQQQPQYQQQQQSINLNKSNDQSSQQQQYQYNDGASTINSTTVQQPPHRPAPPPKPITTVAPQPPPKPISTVPAPQYLKPQYQPNQSSSSPIQDGASTPISLDKSSDEKSLSDSVKKHSDVAKTNANIALHSIGAPINRGTIHANIPPLYLSDATYLLNIQYTEIVLEIEETTIRGIQFGKKMEKVYKKEKLFVYKTIIEDVIIIQIGEIFIYTNLREKPCFRAYPYHYVISDNYNNYFMIKLDKDSTTEEQINKLELLLTYYTTYYRVPPKVEYDDKTARKLENAADKTENTSQSISNGLVTGGTYVAKGANKVSLFYQKNTKKYDGPEMTEEQRKELEDPDSKYNKTNKTTQKMVQGTASVSLGIKKGCGFVGSKVSQGVQSTSWYKEKEAKKQEEERINGKNEKKEAGGQMASSGVGALKTVFGGFEEGVLISARGIRDASVDATRHTSGDFAAEKSKKGWNSAGDVTLTVVNLTSILGATWIKAIVYAGVGAITYDPNMVNALGGSYWKAGWVSVRSDLLSGSNWHSRWLVLRNATLAIYTSPTDPAGKPLESYYLNTVRGVSKICETRSHRPHCFDVITVGGAISLSTHVPDVDFSNTFCPNPDDEVFQWSNSILSVSTFVGDLKED